MLELIPVESEQLIAYRTEGKIASADFERVADRIEEKLEGQSGSLRIYAEIESLSGIGPMALWKDLKFGARHITDLDRFDRIAVVSDEGWIENLARLEGAVIPGVEIETFSKQDRERAMAWALA